MILALDPEFVTGREVPDVPLDVLIPALAAKCKMDRLYTRMDGWWYVWEAGKRDSHG